MQVEAELAAVEVEIAKVKLEEEKVVLQQKKVELVRFTLCVKDCLKVLMPYLIGIRHRSMLYQQMAEQPW